MATDKLTTTIYDLATGEVTVRDLTAEEIAQYEKDQEEFEQRKETEALKKVNRQAILDRLGLTSEEAALLLS